jgi:uncharacterized repeat protein (TIGR03803 family)
MKSICMGLLAGAIGLAHVLPVSAIGAGKTEEQVLYSFRGGNDGATPWAGLIDVQGTLYGTTREGGGSGCEGYGCGTVYSLRLSTGAESVLYSFCSQQNCADGATPAGTLVDVNGTLFGTTLGGGRTQCEEGCGTLFALDPDTGAEKLLYSFCSRSNCRDGEYPYSGLINVKGTLYGTTQKGGTGYAGTVFSFDPGTGKEEVVYSFGSQQNHPDGREPEAGVIDVNGTLFGTTFGGGSSNTACLSLGCGAVFALDADTGAESVSYEFCSQPYCADGEWPLASLLDVEGTLYGTTSWGGASETCNAGCGAVFALDPATDAETVVYSFCSQTSCADGLDPVAGLIEAKGSLYGTTYGGGGGAGCRQSTGCGAVFSLDPSTGAEAVIHGFCSQTNCPDGSYPQAGLIDAKGTLYGTASSGGAGGDGVVFALQKP